MFGVASNFRKTHGEAAFLMLAKTAFAEADDDNSGHIDMSELHKTLSKVGMKVTETVAAAIVEASPHDAYWGGGRDGKGSNHLGRLLMELRADLSRKGVSSSSSGVATG